MIKFYRIASLTAPPTNSSTVIQTRPTPSASFRAEAKQGATTANFTIQIADGPLGYYLYINLAWTTSVGAISIPPPLPVDSAQIVFGTNSTLTKHAPTPFKA